MSEQWRVVLDTNVFLSAALSRNLTSPTRELLERWMAGDFAVITCEQLATELIEKLLDRKIEPAKTAALVAALARLAEWVVVPPEAVHPVLADADDDIVLACALCGEANVIVTYDPHFDLLQGRYGPVEIMKALPFLWRIRGDLPPNQTLE